MVDQLKVKPREVRQARAYLYRRGVVVPASFCRMFARTAKAMNFSYTQLHEAIHAKGHRAEGQEDHGAQACQG